MGLQPLRGQSDRVRMHPPFNKGQDLKHIAHAATHWLKPGGQLFALMRSQEDDAISQALGAANDLCSWSTEDIEAGAFKESSTPIRTSRLLLEKSERPATATQVGKALEDYGMLTEAELATWVKAIY
jgi:hypothetical protein